MAFPTPYSSGSGTRRILVGYPLNLFLIKKWFFFCTNFLSLLKTSCKIQVLSRNNSAIYWLPHATTHSLTYLQFPILLLTNFKHQLTLPTNLFLCSLLSCQSTSISLPPDMVHHDRHHASITSLFPIIVRALSNEIHLLLFPIPRCLLTPHQIATSFQTSYTKTYSKNKWFKLSSSLPQKQQLGSIWIPIFCK